MQLLDHLGIERTHCAASSAWDVELVAELPPSALASLTLVHPHGVDFTRLAGSSTPLSLLCSDAAGHLAVTSAALADRPRTMISTVPDYPPELWEDAAADHPGLITQAIATVADVAPVAALSRAADSGNVAGIRYQVHGQGQPILLFPLNLAPSQWQPLLPTLAQRFMPVVLGGPLLGTVKMLEDRGRSPGYQCMVRAVVEQIDPRRAGRMLEVGCGSGVATRVLARTCAPGTRITAVDLSSYLLSEAKLLCGDTERRVTVELVHGNAERLPAADDSYDAALAVTVLEEIDTDTALAEMVRVTRPGGRIGVVVRALDTPGIINAPLPARLKRRIESDTVFSSGVTATGCADASLYRRLGALGLESLVAFPQLVTYREAQRLNKLVGDIAGKLDAADRSALRRALAAARAAGTFFIAHPYHCVVATVATGSREPGAGRAATAPARDRDRLTLRLAAPSRSNAAATQDRRR